MIISESLLKQIIQEETEALLRENAKIFRQLFKAIKKAKKTKKAKSLDIKSYEGSIKELFDDYYKLNSKKVTNMANAKQWDELVDDLNQFYRNRARDLASKAGTNWLTTKGKLNQAILNDMEKAVKKATGTERAGFQKILDQTKLLDQMMPVIKQLIKMDPATMNKAGLGGLFGKSSKFIAKLLAGGALLGGTWLGLRQFIPQLKKFENFLGKNMPASAAMIGELISGLTNYELRFKKSWRKFQIEANPEFKFCDAVEQRARRKINTREMTRDQAIAWGRKEAKGAMIDCDKFYK